MTRAEAEALVLLADREWFRGADERTRKQRTVRTATVLDLWEGEHGFDGETISMLEQGRLDAPAQPRLPDPPAESTRALEDPRRRTQADGRKTSLQAAESIDELRERQRAVREALERLGSATDERLIQFYKRGVERGEWPRQAESGIRTRRHELAVLGFVRDTGQTAAISTGSQAIVWAPTEKR